MSRANGLTKVITAGFFLLAVTGFVAYRSGWLHPETQTPGIEETPEVPVAPTRTEDLSESNLSVPENKSKLKATTSNISMDQSDTFSSGNDSLVIIENDMMRKKTGIRSGKNILQKEEPVMFSGSKTGHIIKPVDLVPLKVVFDSIFKPAKQQQ